MRLNALVAQRSRRRQRSAGTRQTLNRVRSLQTTPRCTALPPCMRVGAIITAQLVGAGTGRVSEDQACGSGARQARLLGHRARSALQLPQRHASTLLAPLAQALPERGKLLGTGKSHMLLGHRSCCGPVIRHMRIHNSAYASHGQHMQDRCAELQGLRLHRACRQSRQYLSTAQLAPASISRQFGGCLPVACMTAVARFGAPPRPCGHMYSA